MATTIYQCETIGCGVSLSDPDTKFCTSCQEKIDRKRECRLCGNQFDPTSYHEPETAVCCGSHTLVDFYRGRPLNDAQLAWALGAAEYVTEEQRGVALALANSLQPGEESVSGAYESPQHTVWQTNDGIEIRVGFAGPYARTVSPVTSIEIGDEYGGLTADQVSTVLAAVTRNGDST